MDTTDYFCVMFPYSEEVIVCYSHYTLNGGEDWIEYSQPAGNFNYIPWSVGSGPSERISFLTGYMYRSTTDFGTTWAEDPAVTVYDYVLDVENDSQVWGASQNPAIVRSENGGTDWIDSGSGLPAFMRALSIDQSPINPDLLLVGGVVAQGYCLGRSEDHGATWTITHQPFPPGESSVLWRPTEIKFSELADSIVFVAVEDMWDGTSGRLYRSNDAGWTWTRMELPEVNSIRVSAEARIMFHPSLSNVVYFSPGEGFGNQWLTPIMRSIDGGSTWSALGDDQPYSLGFVHCSINRLDPPTLIESVGGSPEDIQVVIYTDTIGVTDLVQKSVLAAEFAIDRIYPNPFNPSTNLNWSISRATNVEIVVYNLRGQRVRTLVSGLQVAGEHEVLFEAGELASGVYLVELNAGGESLTQKILLLK